MDNSVHKCVMVIATGLPLGLVANTAGVLAVTLGRKLEAVIGPDVADGSGQQHAGIISITLPILSADGAAIKRIREQAASLPEVYMVDFTETAQRSLTYPDYTRQIAGLAAEDLVYLGLALYGPKKPINRLTGNLRLLRDPVLPGSEQAMDPRQFAGGMPSAL